MNLKRSNGRLREAGVRKILEDKKAGCTYQEIAERMGVSIGTVFNVVKKRTHADIMIDEENAA